LPMDKKKLLSILPGGAGEEKALSVRN
jgi:hypothetical protein